MKKFVFTNEKYHSIKEKEFDRLKQDMRDLDKAIEEASAAKEELRMRFMREREDFDRVCKEGVGVGELMNYHGFFEYLKEEIKRVSIEVARLMNKKSELTQALTRMNNELKVLEQMREEQYQEYCKEVAQEEAKELDSIMSFNIFEKAV